MTLGKATTLSIGSAALAAATYWALPRFCGEAAQPPAQGSLLAALAFGLMYLRKPGSDSAVLRVVSAVLGGAASLSLLQSALIVNAADCSEDDMAVTVAWAVLLIASATQMACAVVSALTPAAPLITALLPTSAPAAARPKFVAAQTHARHDGLAKPLFVYIPDGLSKEEWKKIQEKEKAKKKNLGMSGPRGYRSRSFQSFQESLERGEASHLFPVDPNKVKSGEIKYEDVPYMQRGGSWDGSDIKNPFAKKRALKSGGASPWRKSDYQYQEKPKNSVSVFGGGNLPWNNKVADKTAKDAQAAYKKKQPKKFGLF